MKTRGLFITFEGPDGSGKTSNMVLLAGYLRRKGYSIIRTREPGGTRLSEMVRKILLKPGMRISDLTELLLYAAARAQHVDEVIRPAVTAGKVVLCDRFTDATVAYQGGGRRLDMKLIRGLNSIATGGLKPDLTILLDVNVSEGLARGRKSRGRSDRLEREKLAFHRRVRKGYRELARKEPGRVKVISSDRRVEVTSSRVVEKVETFLKRKGGK